MNNDKEQAAVRKLLADNCSCVIANNGGLLAFYGRGVTDLYNLLTTDAAVLDGAFVADKIVGKGAAALLVLGRVKGVYADLISEYALDLLQSNGIACSYALKVEQIKNRAGTGMCPVEKLCLRAKTPQECLPLIAAFLSQTPTTMHNG